MTDTKRQLEAQTVFPQMINDWGLLVAYAAAHPDQPMPVAIVYRAQSTGRSYQSAAWQVIRPGYKTNPDGHWRDNGHQTFTIFRPSEQRAAQLDEAMNWARERYGVVVWKRTNRLRTRGAYFPAAVVDWFEAQIKAAR